MFWTNVKLNRQAGTGLSRRYIQGSKIAKGLPSVNLQYSKIEKPKNGPSGAPGPASASPWRAKRGTLPKLLTFLSQLKGGPFGEKTNFRKKSHNAEKLKGGTLWDFLTSILSQNSKKNEGGDPLAEKNEKSHNAKKTERGTLYSLPVLYVTRKKRNFFGSVC